MFYREWRKNLISKHIITVWVKQQKGLREPKGGILKREQWVLNDLSTSSCLQANLFALASHVTSYYRHSEEYIEEAYLIKWSQAMCPLSSVALYISSQRQESKAATVASPILIVCPPLGKVWWQQEANEGKIKNIQSPSEVYITARSLLYP